MKKKNTLFKNSKIQIIKFVTTTKFLTEYSLYSKEIETNVLFATSIFNNYNTLKKDK